MSGKRVLMAMSGGLDSSVAAILLKEQAYDLIGITLRVYHSQFRSEPLEQSIRDAYILAAKLDIPYYVIDVFDEFKETVIDYFIDEYRRGKTPNPCVLCNYKIKWKYLIELADKFNCNYIATGHYAVVNKKHGRYYISKGVDELKDQSYFLWRLSQEYLKRTLFPLGRYTKHQIRAIAESKGFKTIATKKESYNICFIPEGNYRNFLEKYANFNQAGKFIDLNGNILGEHSGIANYTIGQRKNLNISHTQAHYVININAEQNTITLGTKQDLSRSFVYLKDIVLSKYKTFADEIFETKIRYKSAAVKSRIFLEDKRLKIEFLSPATSLTPGQSAVVYEGNDIVVAGIII